MRNVLTAFIVVVAAIVTVAAAGLTPVYYVERLQQDPIGMWLAGFLWTISMLYVGYVVLNILSWVFGQGDAGVSSFLYWLDYYSSMLAWLSFTLTTGWVWLGGYGWIDGMPRFSISSLPMWVWVLTGLMLFSWIDVGWFQLHKHGPAWQRIQVNRTIAPPPYAPPAARTPVTVEPPMSTGRIFGIIAAIALFLFVFNICGTRDVVSNALSGLQVADNCTTNLMDCAR